MAEQKSGKRAEKELTVLQDVFRKLQVVLCNFRLLEISITLQLSEKL